MPPTVSDQTSAQPLASTGIEGLDHILGGGLTANRLYLLEGMPGSGKTTLAFQFLREGVRRGERALYIALSETEEETRAVAASHGWSLDGIFVRELVPTEESLQPEEQYTMFHPSEVELTEATKRILTDVEELKPARVVLDSLSEFHLLAGNPLRYRRQMLALKQFFAGRRCTVLLLDDLTIDGAQSAGAKHCARRGSSRAADSGIRRAPAAAAGAQVSRRELPRRLSRLHHRARRPGGVSAPGRRRAPPTGRPGAARERPARVRQAARAVASSAAPAP